MSWAAEVTVGPPLQEGYVPAPSFRKRWEVETVSYKPDDLCFEEIEADNVLYGNGVIEFYGDGEVVALFNLDSVVAVRTIV